MAKVSLRIYNREIERLIEQGQTDEAIAHCRHILQTFPKHLETYRMLGKAYLEARRYREAVDIFGRLLMAVPDDFVSHVGLSIIRDEEGKLDDAIWHMERAFEVQSSNAAIQGELQRLYGRRDGMEPPKIRMTRGALARIYVHGELYPQAIAEIRSVLAEDPQRVDMQVLLAHAYSRSGQRSDATDICNQLLQRYIYCFDANRIMVELLPATTDTIETTQVYRMHIAELDPYSTFAKGFIFQTEDVPDASVNLERLEYSGEEVEMGQDWNKSSIGFAAVAPLGSETPMGDAQPDWLRSVGMDETPRDTAVPVSQPQAEEEENIPDFLRDAGWGSSSTPEKPTSIFDEEPGDDNLVQADIPDWLKSQEPVANEPGISEPTAPIETPDFLSELDSSFDPFAGASTPTGETPDWLRGVGDAGESAPSFETSPAQPLSASSDVPDWLKGTDDTGESIPSFETSPAQPIPPFTETPQPVSADETPDWLAGLGSVGTVGTVSGPDEPTIPPADIPDWLRGMEPKRKPSTVDNLGSSAQEQQDDAVAWLESLAAKHGAKPEELVTDPNKHSEATPEWMAQAQNAKVPTPSPAVDDLASSAQEQDDAVAWLESLAAKHGAKPEELVTDPNKRSETPPEWVAQAQNVNATTPPPTVESLGSSTQEQDDAVAWLESLAAKHGARPEELVTDPNKRSEAPPEWVAQAQNIGAQAQVEPEPVEKEWSETAQNIGEEFISESGKSSASQPAVDETGLWLRSLEEERERPETPVDIPDWMKPEEERPPQSDQVSEGLDRSESLTGERPPSSLNMSNLPDWLGGLDQSGQAEQPVYESEETLIKNQDLSDWLSGLDDEPGLDIDLETLRAPQQSTEQRKTAFEELGPADTEDLPDWMEPVAAEEDEWKPPVESAPVVPSTPAPDHVSLSADLPDWLQSVDEGQVEEAQVDDDAPPWIHREKWEKEEGAAQPPKPTSPSDWHPASVTQKQEPGEQLHKGQQRLAQSPPSPEPSAPAKKKTPPKQRLPRQHKSEGQGAANLLGLAKSELDRGDIPEALVHYGKLIKKGKHLEEVIGNLTESLYRYPVEVSIWQALGDAYMRANRLKEALEAYNKAEELIR